MPDDDKRWKAIRHQLASIAQCRRARDGHRRRQRHIPAHWRPVTNPGLLPTISLGLILIYATVIAACNSSASNSPSSNSFTVPSTALPVQTVSVEGITFSYPQGWARTQWDEQGSFTYMVAAVSNGPLKTPCSHHSNGWTCGPPVDSLRAGVLLVMWWRNGFPAWTLAAQPGDSTSIAGHKAKIQDPAQLQDVCPRIGADSALRVVVERADASDNFYQFDACFKGPGVDAERSEALAILRGAQLER